MTMFNILKPKTVIFVKMIHFMFKLIVTKMQAMQHSEYIWNILSFLVENKDCQKRLTAKIAHKFIEKLT